MQTKKNKKEYEREKYLNESKLEILSIKVEWANGIPFNKIHHWCEEGTLFQ